MKKFKFELENSLMEIIPKELHDILPTGFHQIGDVAILNINPELSEYESQICAKSLEIIPRVKTICVKGPGVHGELRVPSIKKVCGNGTMATHLENGIKFRFDVTKVMFAKGNVEERARIPKLIAPGETVIDMFAGIGYFCLPIAKHSQPSRIIAMEKNPDSVEFLKENIKINDAQRIDVISADNRDIKLKNAADRIIMGYFPNTEKFLPKAFELLKYDGIIHFHNTVGVDGVWKEPMGMLRAGAKKAGYSLSEITYKKVVKHFCPGVEHIVIDARFEKI